MDFTNQCLQGEMAAGYDGAFIEQTGG